MKPVAEQNEKAHGLRKIHKSYTDLPKLRPTIDNTNTLFTSNESDIVKDSFEVPQRIHEINTQYFDQGYAFVSFDVDSLFTNVSVIPVIPVVLVSSCSSCTFS